MRCAKDVEEEAPRKEDVWKSGEQQGEKGCFLGFISRAKSRGVFEQSVCVCVCTYICNCRITGGPFVGITEITRCLFYSWRECEIESQLLISSFLFSLRILMVTNCDKMFSISIKGIA